MTDCCCEVKCSPEEKKTPKLKIIKNNQRVGGCVEFQGTLYKSICCGTAHCFCTQFYFGQPLFYQDTSLSSSEKEKCLKWCRGNDATFYLHCPLNLNLAKADAATGRRVVSTLSKELAQIQGLPAACVVHIGKVGKIETVGERLNTLIEHGALKRGTHERTPHSLLLEVAAGQGTELGKNWEEIRHLYEALDQTKVGLCLDTAHLFASGMSQLQSHEQVVKLFEECDSILDKGVSLVHLNGSKCEYCGKVDRHAPVGKKGEDFIWSADISGLKTLVSICAEKNIDMISETSDPESDIAIVKSMYT